MAVYRMTPTKGNLIKAKDTLQFSKKGYELLDKKRTVLIKEMMSYMKKAQDLQNHIEENFEKAYHALENATITIGAETLDDISRAIESENDFEILYHSVMGVEVPNIKAGSQEIKAEYGFYTTNPAFDLAIMEFHKIQTLIYELAVVETAVYRLGINIKKTQKRANALEKIQIPRYEREIKRTQDVLEEKEREEFFRMKKVKKIKK